MTETKSRINIKIETTTEKNDIFSHIILMKKEADNYFKTKKYNAAINFYNLALAKIDEIFSNPSFIRDNSNNSKILIYKISIPIYLNLSLCYLNINNNEKCIELCNKVLEIEKENKIALFRKAKALINNNNKEESWKVLQNIEKNIGINTETEMIKSEWKNKFNDDYTFKRKNNLNYKEESKNKNMIIIFLINLIIFLYNFVNRIFCNLPEKTNIKNKLNIMYRNYIDNNNDLLLDKKYNKIN
jgi:tetratricopeptide (TPR) repeat protein